MEELLNAFAAKEGVPTDEEINTLARQWREYISKTNLVRALECDKDFKMGMIMMYKRLNNENNN
jgi:hypothetical protein